MKRATFVQCDTCYKVIDMDDVYLEIAVLHKSDGEHLVTFVPESRAWL